MKEILIDTGLDLIKLIPFLFLTFLLMEYFEHKLSDKSKKVIEKSGKFGPIFGSLLGAVPQCGFSVSATNLYAGRIISVGTLIAIYLSTSDEMIPIMLNEQVPIINLIKILLIKIMIGMIFGFIIDLICRKREAKKHFDMCDVDHCDCEHGILKSSIKHTIHIALFIGIISLLLNIGLDYLGEEKIGKLLLKGSIFSPFLASLVGLIPNCVSSVILTEVYLANTITFGSLMAGLLTGSGVGILVLFKQNKNLKDNIKILLTIYFIGVICGIIIDLLKISL